MVLRGQKETGRSMNDTHRCRLAHRAEEGALSRPAEWFGMGAAIPPVAVAYGYRLRG
jgi:hypothetical protein